MISSNQKEILFGQISKYVEQYNVSSLLDIGAGDGILAKRLAEKVKNYIALEGRPENIQKLMELGLSVVPHMFPCKISGKFDMVLSSHSIPEQKELLIPFLEKTWRLVKSGGVLLIATFKGGEGEVVRLSKEFLGKGEPLDKELFDETINIVEQFGTPAIERANSMFSSRNLKEITEIASNSIGGSPEEKARYKEKLEKLISSTYKKTGKYFFPFEHVFILVEKK